jgi:nicotinamidase-related amidase
VDPATTALVLIEFQNDFTTPGGALHAAVSGTMDSVGTLPNATIVHSPIAFQEGYNEISRHPYGILKGVVDSTAFVKGSWGAEIVADLAPCPGDIVIEGKRGLDAFGSTNLDFILRSKGISTIVLAGFLTNCCVESTMRTAYERGYEVITLTDAVGATSGPEHDNAIAYDYPMFSKPTTTAEFVAALEGEAATADSSRGY